MPAPLTIVIPTLNAADELHLTLGGLVEGLQSGLVRELVFSDGGSTDQTHEIADEAGAELVIGVAGRGGQLSRGASIAKGEWLLFLHADTLLAPGWADAVADHIKTKTGAGYFKLGFRATGVAPMLVAFWANLRSRFGLPYGDQGLLISREHFDQLGGYADIPLMEDVDIVNRSRGKIHRLDAVALTSAKRYQQRGWLRQSFRNLLILVRYFLGVSPEKLSRTYHRDN